LWTEDAVAYPADAAALTGRAALLADNTAFFGANTPNDYTATSAEMKVAGDWAYDRGTSEAAFTPKVKGAVWSPSCGDRLGSVQFFSPAHGADGAAIDDGPAVVEPPPPPEFGQQYTRTHVRL
jgi:hypothetical protein